MLTVENIKTALKKHEPALKAKYPITSIAIFGSFARNNQNAQSDVDVLVDFNGIMGLRFVDLAEDLEKILGNKVDLICRKDLKETFWNNIKNDIRIIY